MGHRVLFLIRPPLKQVWAERRWGDLSGACQLGERAVKHQRAAFKANPGSFTYGLALQQHYRHLGETLLAMRDYVQAAQVAQQLAAVISRCPIGESTAMDMLSRCAPLAQQDPQLSLGEKRRRAKTFHDQAAALARQLAKNNCSGLPRVQNNVAWFLVACPDEHYHDPKLAVTLAEKAVRAQPQISCYRNTLGLAYYRKGDWQAAIRTLKKSIELSAGAESTDWLFLAMSQWKAGQKEQARKTFYQALPQQVPSSDEELCRFRAEAAALLELPNDGQPKEDALQQ